jgi:hypothetical protein
MRGWLVLLIVCASSAAVADDAAFSPASLGGGLEGAVAAATDGDDVPPTAGVMTTKNREVFDRVISKDMPQLGKFTGVKRGSGTSDDTGGFTAEEIDRVIKSRARDVRACYQKELSRTPKLAGKIVARIEIAEDGVVTSATIKSTTMKSSAVESCLSAQLKRLKFPARGAKAIVTYPFIFTAG